MIAAGPAPVEVRDLTKRFGDFTAVSGVSFSVREGEIFGFLGPNGAGKSTTIKMICGLHVPTSGQGTVAGYDIMGEQQQIKQHLGYMSQAFSLYEDLTVEENIDFYARVYGMPRSHRPERKRSTLEVASLTGQRRQLTASLPRGWKQRLALACAIMHEPSILFLDEPTSGVDPQTRRSFWDLIYELSDAGMTVFATTHYMEEAEYCDRLGLISRGSLGMGIAIPVILILLFGYALTLDVDNVPTYAWDQDGTPLSREYLSRLIGSRYFTVVDTVDSYRAIERGLDRGEVLAGVVVPSGFAGDLEGGRDVQVQALVDGSDANTASITRGYLRAVNQGFNQYLGQQPYARSLVPLDRVLIDVRTRVWFNADLESRNYIIPGLIAVIMMVIAALLTSLTIAREWENGTMEPLLATPLQGPELILGKLIPYFLIGMLDVLVAVLMGEFVFGVPLRGNVFLLFGVSAVFLVGALSLGLLVSILAKGQLLASQLAMVLTFLPAFLLSGFMYDIANMPRVVQWITYLVPARYFVFLLKGIYLKGSGLDLLYVELALLSGFGLLMLALAVTRFRKKLI